MVLDGSMHHEKKDWLSVSILWFFLRCRVFGMGVYRLTLFINQCI